jgi:probable HAF family extracellular repeat protein
VQAVLQNSEAQKTAGESYPRRRTLTGQAKPRRSVCAPRHMAFSLYRRPVLERRNIMWFSSWLGKRRPIAPSGRDRGSVRKRLTCRPQLVALEDRLLPSGGYVFQTIDDPNGINSAANGINSRGEIVGNYMDGSGAPHGFLQSHGQYTNIDDPNAGPPGTYANGINARLQIVGYYFDASYNIHGFLLSGGQYTNIDDPNGVGFTFTYADGINAHGQIVGFYSDAKGGHGFLLSRGQYTTLDDPNGFGKEGSYTTAKGINDRGQIVGFYQEGGSCTQHGFLFDHGQYTTIDDPNGVNGTQVWGINDRGQIVGTYFDASLAIHGFLLSHGTYTTLDDPNAVNFTAAGGINDSGQVVGQYYDASGSLHGFLASKDGENDALGRPSLSDGRAGTDLSMPVEPVANADEFLPAAAVINARLTSDQAIDPSGGFGANGSDDLSRSSSGQTAIVATAPWTLYGSGDQILSAAAAGKHSAQTGDDVFAPIDAVFADMLPN